MSMTGIIYNLRMEEVQEKDNFVEGGEADEDEVDIDDEFEDIEEEEEVGENNNSAPE